MSTEARWRGLAIERFAADIVRMIDKLTEPESDEQEQT